MASGILPPSSRPPGGSDPDRSNSGRSTPGQPNPSRSGANGKLVEYERFIEKQLRKTRNNVRSVDVAGGLLTLAAGALAYFFVVALIDHWLVYGGLGFWGRLIFLVVFLAGATFYFCREILPLFIKRINPVYAAQTIERSKPSLKNSLVNFLLFRSNRAGLPDAVYQAIEEQAATNLARMPVEAAVDRTKLIKIGYVTAGVLLVCAIYYVVSPKNPLRTLGRVVMPWADIQAPTRVTIQDVQPGDTREFHGRKLTVSAEVRGLKRDEPVTVYYSTVDGQTVDRALAMHVPAVGYRHTCEMPESGGVQQDLRYRIVAGDCVTPTYRVEVLASPTIVVQSVEYAYPKYAGLIDQRIEHQGDLKGLEGTSVTLHAVANQDIKTAEVDFDSSGTRRLPMKVSGREATVSFQLELKEDRVTPKYASYQLLFTNGEGQTNPEPLQHQIQVTPDLPPEVEFLAPKQEELAVPANSALVMEITAGDPDFGLKRVKLMAAIGKQIVLEEPLLDAATREKEHRGQFVRKYRFAPKRASLKPGDVVDYWAVAEDNKQPTANRTETTKRRLRIVSPTVQKPDQDQLAQNDPAGKPPENGRPQPDNDRIPRDPNPQNAGEQKPDKQNQANDPGKANQQRGAEGEPSAGENNAQRKPGDAQNQKPGDEGGEKAGAQKGGEQKAGEQQGNRQQGENKPGEEGAERGNPPEPQRPIDNSGADDGDAFNRILEHQQEKEKPQPPEKQPNPKPQDAGKQGAEGGQKGKPQAGNQQPQESGEQSGDQQQSGASKPDEQQQSGNDQKQGNGQKQGSGDQKQGGEPQKNGQQQPGAQGDAKPGLEQAGEPKPGEQKGGEQKPGEQKSGDKNSGDQKSGNQKPGEQKAGGQQPKGGDQGAGQKPQNGSQQKEPSGQPPAGQGENGKQTPEQKPGGKEQGGSKEPGAGHPKPGGKDQGDQQQSGGDQPPGGKPKGAESGESNSKEQAPDSPANMRKSDKPQNSGSQKPSEKSQDDPSGDSSNGSPDQQSGEPSGAAKPSDQRGGAAGKSAGQPRKGSQPTPGAGEPDSGGQKPEAGAGQKPEPGAGQKPEPGQHGEPTDQKGPGEKQPGGAKPEQRSHNPNDRGKEPGDKPGEGAKSQGEDVKKPGQKPSDDPAKPKAQGGDGEDDKGQSGAGQRGQSNQGSPTPQGANQQKNKKQNGGGQDAQQKPNDSPESPSNSEKQSDSQSDSDGDRSGGGGKGGGQKANKPGTGGAGQNTAADEGGGRAKEPGQGETSDKPGDAKAADHPTGKSGTEQGPGSKTRPKAGDADAAKGQPGGEQGPPDQKPQTDKPGERGQQQAGPGDSSQMSGGGGSGAPNGGQPSPDAARPQGRPPEAPPGEDPNLEYTKKATDLALKRLKDQLDKNQVDADLLKKLGWSKQELDQFVRRWETMQRDARAPDAKGQTARKQLDDTLRSLGVRPRGSNLRSNSARDDRSAGLNESRHTSPPSEYAEQYKAYTQGAARGK